MIQSKDKRVVSSVNIDRNTLHTWKKLTALAGLGILFMALALAASCLLGAISIDTFAVAGQSGIRTLAGISVTGCLLAAIGYWEE